MNDDRKIEVYREADTSKLFSYIDNVSLSREMKAKLIKNAEDAKNTNPGGMKIVRGSFLGFGVSAAVMCLILGGAFLYMKANPADIPILSGRVFEPRSESSISAVSEEMVDVEDTLPKNSVANVENDHDTESMDGFANNRGIAGVPANTVTATTNGDEGQADAAVHTPPPTETTRTVTSATTNTSGGTTESSAMPPPPPSPPLQPTPPTTTPQHQPSHEPLTTEQPLATELPPIITEPPHELIPISMDLSFRDLTDSQLAKMIKRGLIPQNVTSLDLGHNSLTDIAPLAGLPNLQVLNLQHNQITELSPLSALTNLETLYATSNQITEISLSDLPNLKTLCLAYNYITELEPLEAFTGLELLYLDNNQITDVAPLAGLTNLFALWLDNNQIADIAYLESLTELSGLFLHNNQITDISPLSALVNLSRLDLRNNPLIPEQIYELHEHLPHANIYYTDDEGDAFVNVR